MQCGPAKGRICTHTTHKGAQPLCVSDFHINSYSFWASKFDLLLKFLVVQKEPIYGVTRV